MIRKVFLGLLLMGICLPLSADVSFYFGGNGCGSAGTCTAYAGATTITFDGLDGQFLPMNFIDSVVGPATYTPVGSGSPFVTGSLSGNYAKPPNDDTTYLTIGSPGRPTEVDITFVTAMRYFGFYMGSPDPFNHVSFVFLNGSTPVATVNGDDLFDPANGDWDNGKYINFLAAPEDLGFTSIRMYSDSFAFETDNHAYAAVPDGGMTLMMLGGALVGLETLRRRFRV